MDMSVQQAELLRQDFGGQPADQRTCKHGKVIDPTERDLCGACEAEADEYDQDTPGRRTFTMGTVDMVDAMADRLHANGGQYPMELNADDMHAVVTALATAVGFLSWDDVLDDVRERAESLFSDIAGTLGIEGI